MLNFSALTELQASLLGLFASLAVPLGDGPPDVIDAPDVAEAPDPNDVYIEGITTGGKGCPDPGTVSYVISEDKKTFLLIYDRMSLENPSGAVVKTTNCEAGIQLHIPSGWQVSLATVTTRGYAYLEKGIKARQTSRYFFAGIPLGASYHTELRGFYDGDYDFTDVIPFESTVWSPCGSSAIFAINTSLLLNASGNRDGVAIFNTTSTDGRFEKVLHWQWKKC